MTMASGTSTKFERPDWCECTASVQLRTKRRRSSAGYYLSTAGSVVNTLIPEHVNGPKHMKLGDLEARWCSALRKGLDTVYAKLTNHSTRIRIASVV